ncbi:MAG TPA: DNA translocase FtsK [Pyrinomonadaceae bacterium]|nr:DNA translocase FtsK [Pyrinomonadaceae bacterium]
MKYCPTCKKTYKDDEQNFCLDDGVTLVKKRGGVPVVKNSKINEVVAVALLAVAVLVFLCLVSYTPSDPTFNTASGEDVQNWIGVVGAYLAEFLLSLVGIIAYLLPAMLALIAWRVFQSESLKPKVFRVVGFVLFVLASTGLVGMMELREGLIGGMVATGSTYLLSTIGASIFLTAMFVVAVLLITDLSFLGMWGNFEMARANFRVHFDEWWAKRAAIREQKAQAAKHSMAKRREQKLGLPAVDSPTITIADPPKTRANAKATTATTMGELAANGSAGEDEFIPPTIAVPDSVIAEVQEPTRPGEIPITKTAPTGDLAADGVRELSEAEGDQALGLEAPPQDYDGYVLPSTDFLTEGPPHIEHKERELLDIADSLAEKTKEFNVAGKVVNISPGPVVTTYEFKPDPGVKYSRVTGLVDDLCLALKAESIRIDRIPGKAYVGIEVPNRQRETIQLRDVIESKKFRDSDSKLTFALGKTIDGLNYVTDLAKMPHLLIAGATGAGKSVGVNSLVVSVLYKARPDEVKFIMVDPKRLELGVYADIPHLATPIITDPKRAAISLKWAVTEMERRYKDLAGYGVRNIDGYNTEARRRNALEQWNDEGEAHRILPYIVIIIDELADLMMVSGKEVEESITRLAQMARAVGIHLVLATQRPSVDVITGLIKANFPARISFRVSSKVDSRTIIDGNGAESLLGRGDMLFLPPATSQVIRVHGAYVDEKEIAKIVGHIKSHNGKQFRPDYDTTITKSDEELDDSGDLPGRRDPLFWDALKCVVNAKRGSTSLLQRHLRIGY